MAKERTYSIKINGLTETIDAVNSLNEKLATLEQRMDALSKQASINIKTNDSGKKADLKEESRLQKEITSTLEKAAEARSEEYQKLLSAKAELKEYQTIAKSVNAKESLLMGSNDLKTMAGMKAELRDIKQAMQTMDVDSEGFREMTKRAGDLTQKLKELEQAYGTYGRNVGNYQSAFQAPEFQKLQITVNGVVREFDDAREALRSLTNERNKLKLMGQDVGDLDKVVKTLKSDIQDMDKSSAGMDMLLDSIQGIVALASTAKGLSSLFGVDDDAIEQTIQKLVALQNVMQGVETVRKQMQTGEGIGKLISKGNDAIDSFVNKLFRLDKAQKAVATSTSGATTATKAASTAQKAANTTTKTLATTTNTLTVAQRAATAASTALSVALKAIGWGLIIAGITALMDLYDKWVDKQKQAKEAQEKFNDIILAGGKAATEAQAKMQMWQDRITKFNGTQDQARKLVQQLNKEYGDSIGKYKTLAEWKKQLTDRGSQYVKMLEQEAKAQAALAVYTQAAQDAMKAELKDASEYQNWVEKLVNWGGFGLIGAGAKYLSEKLYGTTEERKKKDVARYNAEAEKALKIAKEAREQADKIAEENQLGDYSSLDTKASKAEVDELKRLNELKISLMKEGREKIIAQLEEERRQKIYEIRKSGSATAKAEIESVNKLYDDKLAKALLEFTENSQKAFDDMWKGILEVSRNSMKEELEMLKDASDKAVEDFIQKPTMRNQGSRAFPAMPTYGIPSAGITPQTQMQLGLLSSVDTEMMRGVKEYIKLQRDFITASQELEATQARLAVVTDKRTKATEKEKEAITQEFLMLTKSLPRLEQAAYDAEIAVHQFLDTQMKFSDGDFSLQFKFDSFAEAIAREGWQGSLDEIFKMRLAYIKDYYTHLDKVVYENAEKIKEKELAILSGEYQTNITKENSAWAQWEKEQEAALAKGLITQKEYDDAAAEMAERHAQAMITLEKKYQSDKERITRDTADKEKEIIRERYDKEIEEYNNFSNAIKTMEGALPQYRTIGNISIIDVKASKQQTQELINNYFALFDAIEKRKRQLDQDVAQGLITPEAKNQMLMQLEGIQEGIGHSIDGLKERMDEFGKDFARDINEVVQVLAQSATDILNSVWDIQDANYQRQLEALERNMDEQQKLYERQQEMTRQYGETVKTIEDEIAESRGDRRQELIDQLNAQMEVQRASLAEEKRIENERKKMEAQKEKLEIEQKKREKKRSLVQAAINAAMAISMAAVNSWPIPAIPMMALAAAVGAAQIAAVAKQKFAKGGQLEGKSHAQGGIPVGNTGIEVEGKEYIIRKESTQPNIGLLDYINKSKRKLTLEDFIDYYDKPSKIRQNVSKMKFADGGIMPNVETTTRRGSGEIIDAIDRLANRPYYVSVAEINNVQDRVGRVQALAGREG